MFLRWAIWWRNERFPRCSWLTRIDWPGDFGCPPNVQRPIILDAPLFIVSSWWGLAVNKRAALARAIQARFIAICVKIAKAKFVDKCINPALYQQPSNVFGLRKIPQNEHDLGRLGVPRCPGSVAYWCLGRRKNSWTPEFSKVPELLHIPFYFRSFLGYFWSDLRTLKAKCLRCFSCIW